MFCACECEVTQFYVVFCVVRTVHKFDFRLVTNETTDKWRQCKGHAVIKTRVFGRIYMFSSDCREC